MKGTRRNSVGWLAAVGALSLALPVLADQEPAGSGAGQEEEAKKGKPSAEAAGTPAKPPGKEKPAKPATKAEQGKQAEQQKRAASGKAFGKSGEQAVRDWFARKENLATLPPGLAKREDLPPGLQRNLVKNGTVPPDQMGKIQPLPEGLASRLPKPPEGVKRGIVGEDVVLVEERSGKVLDIIKGAVPSRKDKPAGQAPGGPPAG